MIAIVDYGAGNLSSVKKALEHLGAAAEVTSDPQAIASAQKIIVPGVGHFCRCEALNSRLREPVLSAISRGVPFLGICVGMQWLFEGSTEAPETSGAALFAGQCSRTEPLRMSPAPPCCLRTATACLRRFPGTELLWRWRSRQGRAGENLALRNDRNDPPPAQQSFAQ